MKKLTPGIRKAGSALVTMMILASIISFYFLFYVPQNEGEIKQRNFRELERITQNMNSRFYDYQKSISWIFLLIDKNTQSDNKKFINFLITKGHLKSIHFWLDSIKINSSYQLYNDTTYLTYTKEIPFPLGTPRIHTPYLHAGFQFKPYIKQLLPKDFFSNYNLVRERDKNISSSDREKSEEINSSSAEIIYQDTVPDITINSYDSLFHKEDLLKSNVVKPVSVGGIGYSMFVTPFNFNAGPGEKWAIIGLVPNSIYKGETYGVSQAFIIAVLFILILLVLAFPFIKLILMSEHERLNVSDVLGTFTCFILVFSLLIFILLHSYSVNQQDGKINNGIQEKVTKAIELNFRQDIARAYEQLDKYNTRFHRFRHDIVFLSNDSTMNDSLAYNNLLHPQYPYFYQVFWQASNGTDSISWVVDTKRPPMSDYSSRSYFKDINAGYFWQFHINSLIIHSFAFQPLYSWTDNEFRAVIAKKFNKNADNKENSSKAKYPLILTGIGSRMPSVIDPVLPADYQFCIINEKGEVQFHSDMNKNLNENFIEECSNNVTLRSAIYNRASDDFKQDYDGKNCEMYITPVQDLPLYIVTMRDVDYADTMHMQVFLFTSVLTIFMIAFSVLQLLLFLLLNRKKRPWNSQLLQADWLYPKRKQIMCKLYLEIAGVNLMMIIATIIAACFNNNLSIEYIIFFNALTAGSFFFYKINGFNFRDFKNALTRNFYIYLIFMWILLNVAAFYFLDWGSPLISFALYQLVVLILCGLAIKFGNNLNSDKEETFRATNTEKPQLKKNSSNENEKGLVYNLFIKVSEFGNSLKPGNYHKHYTCMLFTWLLLSGGLPVILFFRQSYNRETLIETKYKLLQTAKEINNRMTIGNIHYDKNFYPHSLLKDPIQNVYGLKIKYDTAKINDYNKPVSLRKDPFAFLHFTYNTISEQELELTKANVNDLTAITWDRGNIQKPDTLRLRFHDWSYNRNRTLTLEEGLSNYVFPFFSNGFEDAGFWLLLILFIIAIWYFINILICKLFLVNFFEGKTAPMLTEGFSTAMKVNSKNDYNRLYVVGVHDAGKFDLVLKELQTGKKITDHIIDFASLNNPLEWELELMKLPEINSKEINDKEWIVLRHFEYELLTKKMNEKKFDLINELILKDYKNIIILSVLHPLTFLSNYEKNENPDDIIPISGKDNFYNWNSILSTFKILYYPLQDQDATKGSKTKIRQIVNDECAYGQFLFGIKEKLPAALKDSKNSDVYSEEVIVSTVQSLASAYYFSIWNSLNLSEKYVLYDLSEDGLANMKNKNALDMLYNKGIIKVDANGLPEIMNLSFRTFILEEAKHDSVVMNDAARGKDSAWGKFRVPVFIIIIATLFFVFYTQQDMFSKATTILASFTASIPIIIKLFSMIPSSKSNDKST